MLGRPQKVWGSHTNSVGDLLKDRGVRKGHQSNQQDENRIIVSRDDAAWTRPGLHHPDPSQDPYDWLGPCPDSGLCPSGATFLTLESPGLGARAP
jgi:hypothetical protein